MNAKARKQIRKIQSSIRALETIKQNLSGVSCGSNYTQTVDNMTAMLRAEAASVERMASY